MTEPPEVAEEEPLAESEAAALQPLLAYIRDHRAFDFTGYKTASLARRIRKRMGTVRAGSYEAYLAVLEGDPAEFGALFDTILINVTAFRRDPEAWAFVSDHVVPAIVERTPPGTAIRCWSAGCATGEEPCTLAALLCEAVGDERFRSDVKIYATDADTLALGTARSGSYAWDRLVAGLGDDLATRYFDESAGRGTFRHDLRRSVIFGRHDLLQDPPISKIDLLLCRNTLMYFTADVQRRVLGNFHFALKPEGFLFLGKAEALATRSNLFRAADLTSHVFQKNGGVPATRPTLGTVPPTRPEASVTTTLLDAAFEQAPLPQLVIDRDENLVSANRQARLLFGIGTAQLRRPLRDLEVSFRPVELRSVLSEVMSEGKARTIAGVEHRPAAGSDLAFLDVQVLPVRNDDETGALVTFLPVGHIKVLQDELHRAQHEVQTAYEELQSVVEELETTNEELQSTNEELETTNEELHSTNEELETMNEELQSTNEELGAVNNELRERSSDLDGANRFLHAVLRTLDAGVIVVDHDLQVRAWNEQAEELWGLRADEVIGQHLLNLDIGLPVDQLRSHIRQALSAEATIDHVELEAVNRRGRTIRCGISVAPLLSQEQDPDGVMLVVRVAR